MADSANRDIDSLPLNQSWLTGKPPGDLAYAVGRARKILAGSVSPDPETATRSERLARDIWAYLANVCEDWKRQHGQKPEREYLFSGRPSFDEAAPYDCAGPDVHHYPHLIRRLSEESYPKSASLLGEIPLDAIFAVLVLREAAADNVEAAQYADAVAGTLRTNRSHRWLIQDVVDRLPRELQRRRGKRPKRSKSPFRHAVERVVAETGNRSYEAFLAEYGLAAERDDNNRIIGWTWTTWDEEPSGLVLDLLERPTDPIQVTSIYDIVEAPPNRWVMRYKLKNGATGTLAVATLQNILSRLDEGSHE